MSTNSIDDEKLTAQIRRKRFVKALKTDLKNAMLTSGQSVGENEIISIDQNIDRIVFATIWTIVNNKSDEDWREDIWLPLMCLGCPELDMDGFRNLVAANCKKEIARLSSTRL